MLGAKSCLIEPRRRGSCGGNEHVKSTKVNDEHEQTDFYQLTYSVGESVSVFVFLFVFACFCFLLLEDFFFFKHFPLSCILIGFLAGCSSVHFPEPERNSECFVPSCSSTMKRPSSFQEHQQRNTPNGSVGFVCVCECVVVVLFFCVCVRRLLSCQRLIISQTHCLQTARHILTPPNSPNDTSVRPPSFILADGTRVCGCDLFSAQ